MLPAAIGILVLGVIVFLVGIISARNSVRGHRQRPGTAATPPKSETPFRRTPEREQNQENPDAMALASGGANQHK